MNETLHTLGTFLLCLYIVGGVASGIDYLFRMWRNPWYKHYTMLEKLVAFLISSLLWFLVIDW